MEAGSLVIGLQDPTLPLLALTGLLAAVAKAGRSPGIGMFLAAVHALVALTPPGRILPDLSDPGLVAAVLDAVPNRIGTRTPFVDPHQGHERR